MTREELKEHCKRQVQQFERVEKIMPVTPNDWKRYEEHKLILELLERETSWIPCSERMPDDEYVLISKKPTEISGDKWSVAIAIRTADPRSRKVHWRDSGFGVIQDDKVLAWMPLPEPYSAEE